MLGHLPKVVGIDVVEMALWAKVHITIYLSPAYYFLYVFYDYGITLVYLILGVYAIYHLTECYTYHHPEAGFFESDWLYSHSLKIAITATYSWKLFWLTT